MSVVRSSRLAHHNVESGISHLCLQIHFCTDTSFGTPSGTKISSRSTCQILSMTQNPQYSTTTTAWPLTENFQMPTFQMPNASADLLPTHQRFMTHTGYVNPMMRPNYQPSAGPTLMNVNNGWLGQFVFPQIAQQNHQATGFQ